MINVIPDESQLARYDKQMKNILSYKITLSHIIPLACPYLSQKSTQYFIDHLDGEGQRVNLLQTEMNYNGKVYFDTHFAFYDEEKMYFITEAQWKSLTQEILIGRSDVYSSTSIVHQYGIEYTNAEYDKIKHSYLVWLLLGQKETKIEYENMGHMHKVFIYISDEYEPNEPNEHLRFLSLLTNTKTEKYVKISILKEEYQMNDEVEKEVTDMCDVARGMCESVFKRGVQQGIEQTIERNIDAMLSHGLPIELISQITNKSISFVHNRKNIVLASDK